MEVEKVINLEISEKSLMKPNIQLRKKKNTWKKKCIFQEEVKSNKSLGKNDKTTNQTGKLNDMLGNA